MLKVRAGNMVLLGLERRNIDLLTAGNPIGIDREELGLGQGKIIIFFGETPEELLLSIIESSLSREQLAYARAEMSRNARRDAKRGKG